jgi:methionine salvage enolase-phosphatase E1
MYNGGKIIAGLIIFVALLTFPFYINQGKSIEKAEPSLDTPVIKQLEKKECIRPKDEMKAGHMKILNRWRDEVVRDGNRELIHVGGRVFEKSLQNGCLQCHSNKKKFCDECHSYAGVDPYCWDCHHVREEGRI